MPSSAPSQQQARATCLVLFLKAPSRSKRRLVSRLGDEATTAATHLLACALEDVATWPGPAVLAAAEPSDVDWLTAHGSVAHEVLVQSGDSLGARINHIDAALRARGFEQLLYIGADCPAIDAQYLARARTALERADAVVGPAADGGVVLMGARKPWPDIATLSWSTPRLLGELVERLASEGWRIEALEPRADVDEYVDLAAVLTAIRRDERPARRALASWLIACGLDAQGASS